jgi:hypothetical protein
MMNDRLAKVPAEKLREIAAARSTLGRSSVSRGRRARYALPRLGVSWWVRGVTLDISADALSSKSLSQ